MPVNRFSIINTCSCDPGDHFTAVRLAEDPRRFIGVFYHDKERLPYAEHFRKMQEV